MDRFIARGLLIVLYRKKLLDKTVWGDMLLVQFRGTYVPEKG